MTKRPRQQPRRALALFAVLIVIVIGALAGTTALVVSGAERARTAHAQHAAHARAAAESGLDAVLAQLATQRDAVLRGDAPDVGQGLTLRVLPDGARVVFRIIDLDPATDGRLASENARLDINTATREILSAIPDLTPEAVDAILRARARAPIEDVTDLASIAGLTLEDLILAEPGGFEGGAIARLLTATAFDPNTQAGAGPGGEERAGLDRIPIHQEDADLRAALAQRVEPEIAEFVLERLGDERPASMPALVNRLGIANAEDDRRRALIDVLALHAEPIDTGRVDLNRAPAPVLAALPGIDAAQAEAIVGARDGLDDQTRRDLFWPVRQGLVPPAEYAQATEWLAVRSMQWRVRIEGGVVPGEDDPFDDIIGGPGAMDSAAARIAGAVGEAGVPDAPLRPRVVLEAVIDLSADRPRLAMIADLTEMPVVRALRDLEALPQAAPAPGAPARAPSDTVRPTRPALAAPSQAPSNAQPAPGARGVRHGRWSPPARAVTEDEP